MLRLFSKLILIFSVLSFVGCSSEQDQLIKRLESKVIDAQRSIDILQTRLSNGTVYNVKILQQYASYLKKQQPEFSEIADTLAIQGTTDGLIFISLQQRFTQARKDTDNAANGSMLFAENTYNELDSIIAGADIISFNMMLTDPINVIADMSNGKLARVESMSKEASLAANKSKDYGAGSQLIGNTNYGSWRRNSSGSSVWTWFAAYAVFSSFNRSPIYYGRWSSNRDYSYYGSVGRHHYSSPKQKATQANLNKSHTDKFAKQGKKFQSPYAKNKVTTAKVSQQRQTVQRESSRNKARSSSSRRGSASSRSASTRTSRSSSRGK